MYPAVTNAAMRKADFACISAGTPAAELMRRAGEAIFHAYDFSAGHTAILCGSGNNGGDGYVLALLLHRAGYPCTIIPAEEKWSADGRFYYDQCLDAGIPVHFWDGQTALTGYDTLADCLFGTGFRGTLTVPYADMIRAANESGVPIVAVDIPSGLHGDSGLAAADETASPLCIRAALTVSIGTHKVGQHLAMAKDVCGRVVNCDIGIPMPQPTAYVCEDGDFGDILPRRQYHSHKGTYGYVAVMGGCRNYSGAVKLANLAASSLRCGCGVVKLLCADSVLPSVAPWLLESTAVPLPDRNGDMVFDPDALQAALAGTAALAVGMGWGNGADNEKILTWLLTHYDKTLILDADGLNCLGRMEAETRRNLLRNTPADVILTPHPKEFERISGIPMGRCAADPVTHVMAYAKENGVILLLKGTATVVTDGTVCCIVPKGCPGMATAGSGDVLSGVLAGMAGYNSASAKMTACGAYLAGLAGEMAQEETGEIGMIASDTVRCLAKAAAYLSGK